MKKFNSVYLILSLGLLNACSSSGIKREVIDSSGVAPKWVKSSKNVWVEDGRLYLQARHEVRGNERANGCYDLARMGARENLLSEIATDVRGSIDNAQQSISEESETILGKVRTSEFKGRLIGFRFPEQYHERYRLPGESGPVERIECFVLGEISQQDYNRIKREVVDRIVEVDPRLKEAITRKQVDFFASSATPAAPTTDALRVPAGSPASSPPERR